MTTVEISKEIEFDAGHRVPFHASKCRNPHGHRYRLRASCSGAIVEEEGRPDSGMLVDFSVLKELLTTVVHDAWDHAMVVWDHDHELLDALEGHGWRVVPVPLIPTAENIAVMAWDMLAPGIAEHTGNELTLTRVTVWETPTSVAVYRGSP